MAYRPIEVIIEEPPKTEVLIGEPEAITVDVGETKIVDLTYDPIIEPLHITSNGEYFAPEGIDGYSPISVNVPIPDGYIIPKGEKLIKENGNYDVAEFAIAVVSIPKNIQPLNIFENGTYEAGGNIDGYSPINVNVPRGRDIVAVSIREV